MKVYPHTSQCLNELDNYWIIYFHNKYMSDQFIQLMAVSAWEISME